MKSLTVKSALALMVLAAGCAHEKAADGDKIVLASASGSATVSLTGGRVLSWKDADGRELFFMPERQWSANGDWSHGGMSICWPWFGRKGDVQSLIHGFGRNSRFALRCRRPVANGEEVVLGVKVAKTDNAFFPYDAEVELTVTLTDSLTLKLKTVNAGREPFSFTGGIQSYFPVADYGKITFFGLDDAEFAAVNGMDKAFKRPAGGFGVRDSASGRTYSLSASGNNGIVVWTPGTVEPANRNLAPDDCPKFIVVGPSVRSAEGAIAIGAGEAYEMSYTLKTLAVERK